MSKHGHPNAPPESRRAPSAGLETFTYLRRPSECGCISGLASVSAPGQPYVRTYPPDIVPVGPDSRHITSTAHDSKKG